MELGSQIRILRAVAVDDELRPDFSTIEGQFQERKQFREDGNDAAFFATQMFRLRHRFLNESTLADRIPGRQTP